MAALNRANDVLFRYIITSLRNGGVGERPFKPATSKIFSATSKIFWDQELFRLKAERDGLWRASRQKESWCESGQILMDRAAETDPNG